MTTSKLMKNKYISAAATLVAAAALVLTGCSNDTDDYTEDNNNNIDNIVRFDVGVQDEMGTRAIYTNTNLAANVTADNPIYFENDFCSGKVVNNNGSWTGTRDGSQAGLPLIWRDRGAKTYVIATFGAGKYTKKMDSR